MEGLEISFEILRIGICAAIVIGVMMTPAYLARVTEKKPTDMVMIRIASWFFGWTGVGWLWALYWAIKK